MIVAISGRLLCERPVSIIASSGDILSFTSDSEFCDVFDGGQVTVAGPPFPGDSVRRMDDAVELQKGGSRGGSKQLGDICAGPVNSNCL